MRPEIGLKLKRIAVIVARLCVGGAFAVAGWAKAIDPWGLVYKIDDYLAVWGMTSMPHEIIVTAAAGLSCIEFLTGILLLTGCLRRSASVLAAAMMAFMLPLTVWIYIANPVSECGCFGDFISLSNGATLAKNILLTLPIVYLLLYNRCARGLFALPVQWMVVAVSLAFPLYLNVMGYNVQPLLDFRPYPTGSTLVSDSSDTEDDNTLYIYERNGRRESFTLDALPDSTWTFVDVVSQAGDNDITQEIEVLDSNGENILPELLEPHRPQLILIISDPELHFLTRSHYVNSLYDYLSDDGVAMIGLVGVDDDAFKQWKLLTRPRFDVYPAEDTALKQLARGEAAVVYMREGHIVWKRSLQSLDAGLPYGSEDASHALDALNPVDTGFHHSVSAGAYLLSMVIIYLLSLSPKILNIFKPEKSQKKS